LQRILGELEVGMPIGAARLGRDRQLLEIADFGGLRVSELVSLPWSQVIRRDSGEAQPPIVGKGDKSRELLIPAASEKENKRREGARKQAERADEHLRRRAEATTRRRSRG
jgi:site-specific recombinase XerC